jgi:hypothetical protein
VLELDLQGLKMRRTGLELAKKNLKNEIRDQRFS